jgi:hypothetical protein
MIASHKIEELTFDDKNMFLTVDGRKISIALEAVSVKLSNASDIEKSLFTISPSGYGVHWPLLDEDISIDQLIKQAK